MSEKIGVRIEGEYSIGSKLQDKQSVREIGGRNMSHDIESFSSSMSLTAGTALDITDNVALDIGYRLMYYGIFEGKDSYYDVKINLYSHELLAGIRVSF